MNFTKCERKEWLDNVRKQLRNELGEDQYKYVKEVFFHLCIEDYTYKLLITRRAYLLFQIFSLLFENDKNEYAEFIDNPEDFVFSIKGEVYNSHSLFMLENAIKGLDEEQSKKYTLLVFDDIIIHGRSVSNVYDKLIKKLASDDDPKNHKIQPEQMYFWCLYKSHETTCLKKEVEERLNVYRPTTNQGWKTISTSLTTAVIASEQGYTSYVDTYRLSNANSDLFKYLRGKSENIVKMDFTKLDYDIEGYVVYNDQNWLSEQENKRIESYATACLRFYVLGADLLIIPYLFIKRVSVEQAFKLAIKLLRAYKIETVPKQFEENKTDKDWMILFLKWTINRIGQELTKKFFEQMSCPQDLEVKLECIKHDETFKGIDEFNTDSISMSDQGLKNEDEKYSQEEVFCQEALKHTLRKYETTGRSEDATFEALRRVFSEYAAYIKEEDELRAKGESKACPQKTERCVGISAADFLKIVYAHFGVQEKRQKKIQRDSLTLLIMQWDVGHASYNLFDSSVGTTTYITGLVRNGEQIFQDIYTLFPNVYPYFQYFIQRSFDYRLEEILKFREYLARVFSERQDLTGVDKELQEFAGSLQKNSSYFDDAFVIRNSNINRDIIQKVEVYMMTQY